MRYVWSQHRTIERANDSLEDDFATGDVSLAEKPEIVSARKFYSRRDAKGYVVTLDDGYRA